MCLPTIYIICDIHKGIPSTQSKDRTKLDTIYDGQIKKKNLTGLN